MDLHASDLWTRRGKVGRAKYAILGVVLFAIKHNLDRLIAAAYGFPWGFFNYWTYEPPAIGAEGATSLATFYATLVLIALPFIWVGVVLTLRRLRDANLPLWMVFIFFLPFINLFFFLVLSILPSATHESSRPFFGNRFRATLARVIPDSQVGSAALGVLITAILAVVLIVSSLNQLESYGWGLFVGVPFFLGLNSVLIYGFHSSRPLGNCILVALLSVGLTSLALFALAVEGFICLMMAAPLAIVIGVFGGIIGFILQQRPSFPSNSLSLFSLVILVFPGFIILEKTQLQEPRLIAVTTTVIIDAPAETVWKNVIAFADLPAPQEYFFRTGIAYPLRAEIYGHGVGAIRHCVFSTGEFIEPITVWEESRLLKFGVSSQPPVMHEWSPYGDLKPPHLENYLVSRAGQFQLTQLAEGKTLLEGTTWYQNHFWPSPYWRLWSDYIISRIHQRVMVHIKNLSMRHVS